MASAVRPQSPTTTLVFYDGVCGLCNRFVWFLLARDTRGVFRFAPLQSDLARRELVPRGHDPCDLDTVFVVAGWNSPAAHLLVKSRAVRHTLSELGAGWSLLARAAGLIPVPLADRLYARVAGVRYRVFGRYDSCPLPRPEWRARFVDTKDSIP
jgi:predicted DCC family thiol-disulfide oxidoreductase YuxK